ncbi:hypothetical protein LCGC14_1904940, partial [marine sediment metagenome]
RHGVINGKYVTGEDHYYSKVTNKDVDDIKVLRILKKVDICIIAQMYDISPSQVYRIVKGTSRNSKTVNNKVNN